MDQLGIKTQSSDICVGIKKCNGKKHQNIFQFCGPSESLWYVSVFQGDFSSNEHWCSIKNLLHQATATLNK